jgi:DNA invertase Pin-like site-specific DNA recombinase
MAVAEAPGFGSARRMLKVDHVHIIRHKVLVECRSRRQVAKEFWISRLTVRRYLEKGVRIRTAAASGRTARLRE